MLDRVLRSILLSRPFNPHLLGFILLLPRPEVSLPPPGATLLAAWHQLQIEAQRVVELASLSRLDCPLDPAADARIAQTLLGHRGNSLPG
jgi:hypothetical protein